MTESKHLKARIRARMARTGERYMTARRQVVGEPAAVAEDHGWQLRGGVHPDSAAIAAVLGFHGTTVSEAMVLGVGGGLGAGYILWEFEAHDNERTLVLGFRNQWQYPDRWASKVLERLGVPFGMHETSGAKGAAARLDEAVAAGRPALATVDRAEIGYWHLPASASGRGGYPIVVHAIDGDRVRIDDRNLAPLSVPRERLDAARARVVSYKHRLVVIEPAAVSEETLRAAARAGLDDAVEHLGARSDSFGLPAWRKWARMLVGSHAKAWPTVFADQRGLAGALLSAYEGIEPVGSDGGHLRGLYADFLDEAAALLDEPRLTEAASAYRALAERWHALAELVLPADVPEFATLREELAAVHQSVVARGDAGAEEAASAAERLWALRAQLDAAPPVEPDFAALSAAVGAIYEAEVEAAAKIKH